MYRRPLFIALLVATLAVARADSPVLGPFQSLQPNNTSAQQTAVQNILAGTDDPGILLQAADLLQNRCIDPSVNTLEYWGPDAELQAQLRASADLLMRLLDRAETLARSQSDAAAAYMHNANDISQLNRWQQLNNEALNAADKKRACQYARLLAAEPEEKKTLADQAISAIQNWERSDAKRQSAAQLQKGKILLAADEPTTARKELARIIDNPTTDDVAQQYQAHYFLTVCDVSAGDFVTARSDLADLLAWQNKHLIGDNSSLKTGADAAAAILQYRLYSAQADQADSAKLKGKYNESAVTALEALVRQQPAMKQTVLDHLGRRYAGTPDIAHADPLVLEALMQRGSLPDADAHTLSLASQAAQMVVKRSDEFPPTTVDYAAVLAAAILDRTGQNAQAAQAYLLLAKRLQDRDQKTAGAALDRAIEIFQTLPADPNRNDDYSQALTLAVAPPFNRRNLLYAQGTLLMQHGDYRAAADVLRQLASGDLHHVDAELAEMICIQQLMHAKSGKSSNESAQQIAVLANDIVKQISGPSVLKARAILIAAETCQTMHHPAQTLVRLQDLPASCRGLPGEMSFLDRAAELRIAALVELDQPIEATEVLAETKDQFSVPVGELVKQIDAHLDAAKNENETRSLINARLRLATWLVNRASPTAAESIRDRLFYADSLRRAGELTKALNIFEQLAEADASESSDPTPLLGEAGVQFDLGNYSAARDVLIPLLASGRLGEGQGAGADAYWEASYELLASNAALAAQGHANAEQQAQTVAYLKRLYIQWGNQIGGKRWHASFESLRQRLAPDFKPFSAARP